MRLREVFFFFLHWRVQWCESVLESDNLKEWQVVPAAVELLLVCFAHLLLPTGF